MQAGSNLNGNSLVYVIGVSIKQGLIFTIQEHPELWVLNVSMFHFLDKLVMWRHLFHFQCGCHSTIADIAATLFDDLSPAFIRFSGYQNILHAQREALHLQEECKHFGEGGEQSSGHIASIQLVHAMNQAEGGGSVLLFIEDSHEKLAFPYLHLALIQFILPDIRSTKGRSGTINVPVL